MTPYLLRIITTVPKTLFLHAHYLFFLSRNGKTGMLKAERSPLCALLKLQKALKLQVEVRRSLRWSRILNKLRVKQPCSFKATFRWCRFIKCCAQTPWARKYTSTTSIPKKQMKRVENELFFFFLLSVWSKVTQKLKELLN